MISSVVLRLVPIVLLAIGLVYPLPPAVAALLLALLGWWLVGPAARKPLRSAPPLPEIPPAREVLESPLPPAQTRHDDRILELQQQLEAGRAREQRLSRELRQWQQEVQSSRQANEQLEVQRQRLQRDLQSCEELLEEQQARADQQQSLIETQKLELREACSTIAELERERERERSQAASRATLDRSPIPAGALLLNSSERDLYPQERQELLLTLLRLAVADRGTGCRGFTASQRALHILDDLIARNPLQRQWPSQQFSNSIRQAFRAESSVRLQQNLRPLGFDCSQAANGHVIVAVRGDDRYQLQVSSTPSDNHSRQNEANRLMRMLLSRTTV